MLISEMAIGKHLFLISTILCVLGNSVLFTFGQTVDITTSDTKRQSRFISFDSKSGDIEVNMELSVPFIKIPLENKDGHGGPPMPLLNLNTKALTVFGSLLVISALILPLFINKVPEIPIQPSDIYRPYGKEHKKTDRGLDIQYFEDSLIDLLFRDSTITPCVQRLVCSAIATVERSDSPTSVDKIIDGLFSHSWFKQAVNGTVIKDAIERGRQVTESDECSSTYGECTLNEQIISNLFQIIGI